MFALVRKNHIWIFTDCVNHEPIAYIYVAWLNMKLNEKGIYVCFCGCCPFILHLKDCIQEKHLQKYNKLQVKINCKLKFWKFEIYIFFCLSTNQICAFRNYVLTSNWFISLCKRALVSLETSGILRNISTSMTLCPITEYF